MPIGYGLNGEAQWNAFLFSNCEMPLLEVPPEDPPGWDVQSERHVMWMIRAIVAAYNGGTLAIRKQRCDNSQIEVRKLLRVTEDFAYVPAESLQEPLSGRARQLVQSNVQAGAWTR